MFIPNKIKSHIANSLSAAAIVAASQICRFLRLTVTETAEARLSASTGWTRCVSRIPGTMESLAINIFLHQPRWKPWLTPSEMKVSEKDKRNNAWEEARVLSNTESFQFMCLSYSLGLMTNWTLCLQGNAVSISVTVGKTAITGDTQSPHPGDTKSPQPVNTQSPQWPDTAQCVQLNPQQSSELLGRTDRQTGGHGALLQYSTRLEYLPLNHCKTPAELGTGFWPLAHCGSARHDELGDPESAFRHQKGPNSPNSPHTPGSTGMGTQACP